MNIRLRIGSSLFLIALLALSFAFFSCGDKDPATRQEKKPDLPKVPEGPKMEISKEGELLKCPTALIKEGTLVLPETVVAIGAGVFDGSAEIKKVSGPKVTAIKARAFANTSALAEVDFPEATTIADNAFNKATALTKVEFPKVKSIGNFAFAEASSLTEIQILSIEAIGNNAFAGAKALNKMAIGKTEIKMGDEDPFNNTPKEKDLLLPEGYDPTKAEPWAVKYGFRFINGKKIAEVEPAPKGLASEGRKITKVEDRNALGDMVTIPEYFNEIGDKVFYQRRGSNLSKITANGVIRIGKEAFDSNSNLRLVEMQRLQYIGSGAFKSCRYQLSNFNKTPNVIEVGNNAFELCESLEFVSFPKVQKIGKDIFKSCKRMQSQGILHLGATPPTVEGGFGVERIPTLVVPKGAKKNYDNWPHKSVFKTILEEGESGTETWQGKMKK